MGFYLGYDNYSGFQNKESSLNDNMTIYGRQYQIILWRITNHFISKFLVSSLTFNLKAFLFFFSFNLLVFLYFFQIKTIFALILPELINILPLFCFSFFLFWGPTDCLVTMFNSSGAFLHSSLPLCHCEGQNLSGCSTCTLNKAFFCFFHPEAHCIIPHECLLSQRNTRTQKYLKWGVWWLSG